MTVSPGEDESSSHQEDGRPARDDASGAAGQRDDWRADPSDADVDTAFADIVARFATDPRWNAAVDAVPPAAADRHPSAGPRVEETGEERARRRELRRLERAEEVAAFAARQAEVEAEREADDAHFTPPEPPPLPRPKGRTVGAVLMLIGGIALLVRPGLLAVGADLALILALLLILGGATLLLTGIWRRRGGDGDGWDDGAVV